MEARLVEGFEVAPEPFGTHGERAGASDAVIAENRYAVALGGGGLPEVGRESWGLIGARPREGEQSGEEYRHLSGTTENLSMEASMYESTNTPAWPVAGMSHLTT